MHNPISNRIYPRQTASTDSPNHQPDRLKRRIRLYLATSTAQIPSTRIAKFESPLGSSYPGHLSLKQRPSLISPGFKQ
jgi:hypothetical protein